MVTALLHHHPHHDPHHPLPEHGAVRTTCTVHLSAFSSNVDVPSRAQISNVASKAMNRYLQDKWAWIRATETVAPATWPGTACTEPDFFSSHCGDHKRIMVKGNTGSNGEEVILCENDEQFAAALGTGIKKHVQAYVPGPVWRVYVVLERKRAFVWPEALDKFDGYASEVVPLQRHADLLNSLGAKLLALTETLPWHTVPKSKAIWMGIDVLSGSTASNRQEAFVIDLNPGANLDTDGCPARESVILPMIANLPSLAHYIAFD